MLWIHATSVNLFNTIGMDIIFGGPLIAELARSVTLIAGRITTLLPFFSFSPASLSNDLLAALSNTLFYFTSSDFAWHFPSLIFTSVLRFAHAGQGEPFLCFIWVMVAFSGKIDMGTLVIETTELISGVIYDLRGLQQLQNLWVVMLKSCAYSSI